MDFRRMAERRRAALSYLNTRPGESPDQRFDRKIEYLRACGRPLLPAVFATESVGPDGRIRRGLVGRYRCSDRLCTSCASLKSQSHGAELSAGLWSGISAGLTTFHVVLTITKPLDVGGFTTEQDRRRIASYWQLLREAWGEFSRRERAPLWASHFRAVDWTASPGVHVCGEVVRAGMFPHFHLIVQDSTRRDPLEYALDIHAAWVRSVRAVVRKARSHRNRRRAYDWIKLKGVFCEPPRLVLGEVKGGVHVRVIESTDETMLRRAVEYASGELVASDVKTGKRKDQGHNRLRSYSIGELLDLRGTRHEGFARAAFRLYVQLVHGLPSHMYSRGKRRSEPQLREGAYALRQKRRLQDPVTRLTGLELRERADSIDYMALLSAHADGFIRGLDEWQAGYYLPEAVPAFEDDDRDQDEKRREIAAALERVKAGYSAYVGSRRKRVE